VCTNNMTVALNVWLLFGLMIASVVNFVMYSVARNYKYVLKFCMTFVSVY